MEAKILIRQSGFFISAVATLSMAALSAEFIADYKLSFFPFSFILIFYAAGIFLRGTFWKKAWKREKNAMLRQSYAVISLFGTAAAALFLYFGSGQITVFPLAHYAADPYLLAVASLWSVYSLYELYMVNRISALDGYKNANYLSAAAIILVDFSLVMTGVFAYLLPASLVLLSASTAVSGIRLGRVY